MALGPQEWGLLPAHFPLLSALAPLVPGGFLVGPELLQLLVAGLQVSGGSGAGAVCRLPGVCSGA